MIFCHKIKFYGSHKKKNKIKKKLGLGEGIDDLLNMFFDLFTCMNVCLCVCMCTARGPGVCRVQKRTLDPLDLELQIVVSHYVRIELMSSTRAISAVHPSPSPSLGRL